MKRRYLTSARPPARADYLAVAKFASLLLLFTVPFFLRGGSRKTPLSSSQHTQTVAPKIIVVAPNPPESREMAVGRAMEFQQESIQQCIHLYARGVPTEPVTLHIHFMLAENGAVRAARLSPLYLERTEAGRCLLDVAMAIRFPSLGTGVSFSVPITLSRDAEEPDPTQAPSPRAGSI